MTRWYTTWTLKWHYNWHKWNQVTSTFKSFFYWKFIASFIFSVLRIESLVFIQDRLNRTMSQEMRWLSKIERKQFWGLHFWLEQKKQKQSWERKETSSSLFYFWSVNDRWHEKLFQCGYFDFSSPTGQKQFNMEVRWFFSSRTEPKKKSLFAWKFLF